MKNRLQPESAGARGERDIGSQAYTDYVKNLTPGEGDKAIVDKDAQKSAKASQEANKEKKLRTTRIDDEYQVENNVPDADYDHATALYKDQWKDRKIADYDKERGRDKRAKEMRADAGEDRKRMYAMTKDKWKHAKYATGEEEGKKSVTGNTPDPKDAYKEEVSPLIAAAAAAIGRLERESFSGTPNMTHDPKFGQSIATNPLGDAEKVRPLPKGATTKATQKKQREFGQKVGGAPKGSTGDIPGAKPHKPNVGVTKEEVEDIEEVTFGISVNKAMAGTTVPPKQKKGFRGVGKPPAGWITRKAGTKPGEMTTAEYDPTLGDLSQLSKTLKKLHNEYVPEEVVEITSLDDLIGVDHHEWGFETRADMVEFALHQIEDMGRSVKKPAVSQSEIDAFLAKGGEIKKIKSKGIPKYAQAAHQKMGPASAHRMYKPGSGKSEEVE